MIELTMQVSEFDYTETLDTFLPDLIKILSESEGVNPLIRKCVGASPEFSKKIVKGILAAMSPKQKEALTVKFLNVYASKLVAQVNGSPQRTASSSPSTTQGQRLSDPQKVQLFGCTFSFAGILMKFSSASNRCGAEFIRRTPLAIGYQLSANSSRLRQSRTVSSVTSTPGHRNMRIRRCIKAPLKKHLIFCVGLGRIS